MKRAIEDGMQWAYRIGYDAGLHGRTTTTFMGAELTAWLHGHYDSRCYIARRKREPLPLSPFMGGITVRVAATERSD